jgi:hypothetical protein
MFTVCSLEVQGQMHRCEHPATAVIRDKVYVFGGMVHNVCINDLADLDFAQMRWHAMRPLNGVLPPPRAYHSMSPGSVSLHLISIKFQSNFNLILI